MLLIGVIVGFGSALLYERNNPSTLESTSTDAKEILYWVAPMDPNFRRDEPGKSPMGMDLVPVYATNEVESQSTVQIAPHVVQNLGVRSEPVHLGRLDQVIETVGYVEYDEDALQHIHTRVDGWVEKLNVKANGDPVENGKTLFEIYSRTLVNAQQEYLLAMDAEQTQLLAASKERLLALGMTLSEVAALTQTRTVNQRVKVVANVDGVVAMLGIREGVYVTPATHVMSVANLERVWILADVMERYADLVAVGNRVIFEVDATPGRKFDGHVEYLYPVLDPMTRSLKVRIRFEASDKVFRPNMFARVNIIVPAEEDVVYVPTSAVIRGAPTDRVVVDLGDNQFQSMPVRIGHESQGFTSILQGLASNDRVVTSGQFLIDSESNIESALARFQAQADREP